VVGLGQGLQIADYKNWSVGVTEGFIFIVLISCLCLTLETLMAQASNETRVSYREDVAGKEGAAPPNKK